VQRRVSRRSRQRQQVLPERCGSGCEDEQPSRAEGRLSDPAQFGRELCPALFISGWAGPGFQKDRSVVHDESRLQLLIQLFSLSRLRERVGVREKWEVTSRVSRPRLRRDLSRKRER